jgi:hypothetical protein
MLSKIGVMENEVVIGSLDVTYGSIGADVSVEQYEDVPSPIPTIPVGDN